MCFNEIQRLCSRAFADTQNFTLNEVLESFVAAQIASEQPLRNIDISEQRMFYGHMDINGNIANTLVEEFVSFFLIFTNLNVCTWLLANSAMAILCRH